MNWTTADNKRIDVTVEDFNAIEDVAAVRSNELHVEYNQLKASLEQAATKMRMEEIMQGAFGER